MNDQIVNPEPFFEPSAQQTGPIEADALFGADPVSQSELPKPSVSNLPTMQDAQDEYFDIEDEEDEEDFDEDVSEYAYMQNRELSWLTFNERVLDQGADESVPLLERLNFISIFWSNLQEFFMVRVGSLTDLALIEPPVKDSKTGMTPKEQIKAVHERCRELYPIQESYYEHVRGSLAKQGVRHLRPDDLSDEQRNYLVSLVKYNIEPFLSPQIINPRHPFPHLENGKLYILLRLDDETQPIAKKKSKKDKKAKKEKGGAENVVLGLIPLPHQCERVIKLPGRGFQFILLEHAIEMYAAEIFSMYAIRHTNVICVTRNADIDANQTGDEQDEDYREHMKRLLKQRARLAPVRLECERPLTPVMEKVLLKKLGLKRSQVYDTIVPLDLSFTWTLGNRLSDSKREKLSNPPFTPAWPSSFDRKRRIMDQVSEKEVLLSYPYESMDPFVQLLKEAAFDPSVISIKITLYRLASQSQLAEALITAAENGKHVTALFELRARFDESNNIEWSQRFEEAGCNVIYGFRDYKVHSKICCITRRLADGSLQSITQLGTGNYNEKTAKLYTDLSFITTDPVFAADAAEFFRNMQLENVSDNYRVLRVAPLQIKPMILQNLDRQIALARAGKPCGAFLKANSITDKDVIEKISEASQAGVGITLFVRGICCIVPEIRGATENVRVVSIVGRLLEHSRIYCFGTPDDCVMYLSSADLMTRNLNKRVEIAWPILNADIRYRILDYINTCLHDTAKLRELRPNKTYTPLGAFCELDEEGNAQPPFDAQTALIAEAAKRAKEAEAQDELRHTQIAELPSTLDKTAAAEITIPAATTSTIASTAVTEMPLPVVETIPAESLFQPESLPTIEPALAAEPLSAFQPIPLAEPTEAFQSTTIADPTETLQAIPSVEPTETFQAIPSIEPTETPQAIPTIEPAETFEPIATTEPEEAFGSMTADDPTEEFESITIAEPSALDQPESAFEPSTTLQPKPAIEPTLEFQTTSSIEPAEAIQPEFITAQPAEIETPYAAEPSIKLEAPLTAEQPIEAEAPISTEAPTEFQAPLSAEPTSVFEPSFQQEIPSMEPASSLEPETAVEPALTDLTIGDILMTEPQDDMSDVSIPVQQESGQAQPIPEMQSYESATIPEQSFTLDAAPELPSLNTEPQEEILPQPQEAQQPSEDQPLRISFDSASEDQPLRISFDSAAEDQPLRISSDVADETGTSTPQQPQIQAPSNQSFIDEGHRELEMPSEKKGFFARLFGKK